MRIEQQKKSKQFRAPSMFLLMIAALVTIIRSRFGNVKQIVLPRTVGPYGLVSEVSKQDHVPNMALGVYEKDGIRYFVKRWEGTWRDLGYYALLREYATARFFQSMRLKHGESAVRFPEPIDFFSDHSSYMVVFEYVDGELLNRRDVAVQRDVLVKVWQFLEKSSVLTRQVNDRFFEKRTLWHYSILLPIVTFLSIVFDPKEMGIIMRTSLDTLLRSVHIDTSKLILAHRDLVPGNVMIAGEHIYILDSENMVLTLPGYDRAFLAANPDGQEFWRAFPGQYSDENTEFLKRYIAIHHILGSGKFLSVDRGSVDVLREFQS